MVEYGFIGLTPYICRFYKVSLLRHTDQSVCFDMFDIKTTNFCISKMLDKRVFCRRFLRVCEFFKGAKKIPVCQ